MNRTKNLQRLQTEEFDCLIIGGGASGAGCALDAVTRGYRTALVEKTDFAAGTSSRSTKLIHGGVRYLERAFKEFDFAQLAQVRHGLQERHIVLRNAPHLARPLALITPVFSWFAAIYYTLGLKLYGWFASGQDTLPKSQWLSKQAIKVRMPTLTDRLHSAVLYYDGQLDDARYCLAIAHTAAEAGAAVANHLAITGFEHDDRGRLTAALGTDQLTGEAVRIRAKVFINCAGPYADHLRLLANPALRPRIRPSKGVHAILPGDLLPGDNALLIPETPDGRVVFAIPFQGQLLLGTTDDDYPQLDEEPVLEKAEIDFLLDTLRPYLNAPVRAEQVQAGFGGLRPLIAAEPGASTKGLVRDHEVEFDEHSQLVSLLGGKWTTYRLMAKDTIDFVAAQLLPNGYPCATAEHRLVGGQSLPTNWAETLRQETQLPIDSCRHLAGHYGDRANHVAALATERPEWAERLHPDYPYLRAEVVYAAREEMACTVRDFIARRIRLEILDWTAARAVAPQVAEEIGRELGWSAEARAKAAHDYQALLETFTKKTKETAAAV
ncbi:MAG: FAD-dependent oxidoreductase [Lewinella sp.]|nr:FAD-dependent oxidoreductase [Lewinella sp.]